MAEQTTKEPKEKKEKAAAGGGGKGGKGGKGAKGERKARGPHAGAGLPVPVPRLRVLYQQTIRGRLAQQLGLPNPHQVPTLEKIVLNVGLGEAIKQPKLIDGVV